MDLHIMVLTLLSECGIEGLHLLPMRRHLPLADLLLELHRRNPVSIHIHPNFVKGENEKEGAS